LSGVDIASLPVSEASGGPDGSGRPEPRNSVIVAIQGDQAVVDVRGFPASKEIVAHLGLPGKSPDLKVASGVTRSDGSARLSFEMPGEWSNGVPVTQDNLVLRLRQPESRHCLLDKLTAGQEKTSATGKRGAIENSLLLL
jgi:hypothetical protein